MENDYMIKDYIINTETSALISYFHNGYEYAQVLEGTETFFVSQSPDEIVKNSFLHIGFNIEGAIESARLILKKKYKLPVGLSAQMNIILIRCSSTHPNGGTVWLINSRIQDIQPYKSKQTTVYTTDGHSLTVDIRTDRLQTRRHQATFLHITLLERAKMKKTMTFLYEKGNGIMLVKEDGHLNYTTVIPKEEKLETCEKSQS